MFKRSSKAKWSFGFAMAAVLVGFLVTSPTVAAAMMRLFRFVPNVGMVDASIPLRVLAEPVSQTRDGMTVTVNEAVLSAGQTSLVFSIETMPSNETQNNEVGPGCGMGAELHLADGSVLNVIGGNSKGIDSNFENRFTYPPIPADTNEALLFIPCALGAPSSNWEIPLHFVPASEDMTLPVTELPISTGENGPLALTKVIETDNGYILIGDFAWETLPTASTPQFELVLKDGNGAVVQWAYPAGIDGQVFEEGDRTHRSWAVEIEKGFVAPLTIQAVNRAPYSPNETAHYEFDAGQSPQIGDEWQIRKEFLIEGRSFTLETIRVISSMDDANRPGGFEFDFVTTDKDISAVTVSIDDHPSDSSLMMGGGGISEWNLPLLFTNIPTGSLPFSMSIELFGAQEQWVLQWSP